MTNTGPDDARRVVSARVRFFFIFHVFYILINNFIGSIYVLKARGGVGRAVKTKTGPNAVNRVNHVWALGVFFFFHFFVLSSRLRFLPTPEPPPHPSLAPNVSRRGVPPFLCSPPRPCSLPRSKRETEGLLPLWFPLHAATMKTANTTTREGGHDENRGVVWARRDIFFLLNTN
jgi:hypothetical protein